MEVVLGHSASDGGERKRFLAPPSLLDVYVGAISILGLAGLVAVVIGTPWTATIADAALLPVAFLAFAAVVGEMRPLPISRDDETVETLSTSAPFILALLAVGGTGITVLVQVVASLGDDLRSHRSAKKSVFNTAQYTLSVLAGRAVFCGLTGEPFFGLPVPVELRQLGPLLASGVAMMLVNRVLVAGVVSIAASQPFGEILRADVLVLAVSHLVLLCIGGVAAVVAADGLAILLLLIAPVVAVYLTTASGIRHAHQALHDSLTGLGNRDRLYKQLDRVLEASDAATGATGLVLMDLDHFKDINDTLGHPIGDQLLRKVAERLVAALGDDAAVHRLGGDEFAVVVEAGLPETQAIARDLLAALDTPVRVGEIELLVRVSAGVAVGPEHGTDAQTLMKNADIALYQAKLDRDRICTYSEELDVNTLDRLQMLADLRTAVDTGQLEVAYQPQVDLTDRRTVGVEALIRWNHPTRGMVPPDMFIPLAENSGLVAELTSFVLRSALAALAEWRAAGHEVRVAVNLSARHLSDLALPDKVAAALDRHGIPSASLVLEVTETGILQDPARADVVLGALRGLGVGIAVDDYGTGHASLSYLKRLEIDELKIDRFFISDMGRDNHDFIIVRSTIALARDLGLRVIAEGVEDEPTAVSLRGLGCAIGQGYHLGRPTTPELIAQRLDGERTGMPATGPAAKL